MQDMYLVFDYQWEICFSVTDRKWIVEKREKFVCQKNKPIEKRSNNVFNTSNFSLIKFSIKQKISSNGFFFPLIMRTKEMNVLVCSSSNASVSPLSNDGKDIFFYWSTSSLNIDWYFSEHAKSISQDSFTWLKISDLVTISNHTKQRFNQNNSTNSTVNQFEKSLSFLEIEVSFHVLEQQLSHRHIFVLLYFTWMWRLSSKTKQKTSVSMREIFRQWSILQDQWTMKFLLYKRKESYI